MDAPAQRTAHAGVSLPAAEVAVLCGALVHRLCCWSRTDLFDFLPLEARPAELLIAAELHWREIGRHVDPTPADAAERA